MQSYHLYIGQLESLSLSLSLSLKHVYVEVVVIVTHIFPWFYVQERLKCPQWVGDRLPISFLKNWQTRSFLVRFPRLWRACSLWKLGYKSWIAQCTSPPGYVSKVNRRLFKDSLCFEINPDFWQFSQALQNTFVSLTHGGIINPLCKIFAVVFFYDKWPLRALEWQNLMTLLTSLSRMHF